MLDFFDSLANVGNMEEELHEALRDDMEFVNHVMVDSKDE